MGGGLGSSKYFLQPRRLRLGRKQESNMKAPLMGLFETPSFFLPRRERLGYAKVKFKLGATVTVGGVI
jgi:hypothetical protein